MNRIWCILIFIALTLCAPRMGTSEEPSYFAIESIPAELPPAGKLELSLESCVYRALEVNYNVQLVRQDVKAASGRVLTERGVFEPQLFGNAGETGSDQDDVQDQTSGEAGLRTRLITGTEISLSGTSQEAADPDQDNDERTRVAVFQPLLRGAGIRTVKANLVIARTNRDISLHELIRQMIDTATDVQNTYWDLVSVRESLTVQEDSLRFARELEDLVRQRAAAGLVPDSDIVEAEAEVYGREASVAQAGESVRATEDRLKESLTLFDQPQYWTQEIVPATTGLAPDQDPQMLPSLHLALEHRPDYQAEMLRLKNADLSLYVAKNGLLPKLDLVADTDLSHRGNNTTDEFGVVTDSDEKIWSVFLQIEIPLGNKAARGQRDEAQALREQRILRLKQLELQIIREIRRAVDAVSTSQHVLKARAKAVESEQVKLDNEQEKLRLGKSDTDTVVRFIQSLNNARLSYNDAMVRYNQALARLIQAQGTTLEQFGVRIER